MRISRALAAAFALCLLLALPAVAAPGRPAHGRVTFDAVPVATGLDTAVTFTFAPSGRIFYGEKNTGEIRILNRAKDTNRHFATISHVVSDGEAGLLGLALHPDYPDQPFVFAYATRHVGGVDRNQILRMRNVNGHVQDMKVIFNSKSEAGHYHDGGRILFGPDRFLYAVQGESHNAERAQDLSIPAGKILRMTTGGAPAPNNPFAGSRVWSFGHRNSFGMDFDPQTGRLWETENGPECTDEINRIVKGGNFGWGSNETCSDPKPGGTNNSGPTPRHLPRAFYASTIAPTGIVFCRDCGLGPATNGKVLFGDCNTWRIHRLALTADRLDVAAQTIVFSNDSCVFSLETGPGGAIYFSDPSGIFRLVRG